jgi:hypothetical protein
MHNIEKKERGAAKAVKPPAHAPVGHNAGPPLPPDVETTGLKVWTTELFWPSATESRPKALAVTVKQAAALSGFGLTSVWALLRDGRLEAVRVPGVRRTLVSYASLVRLLAPPQASPQRRRPRKGTTDEAR